jgi:hypothetical protein
MPDYRVAMLIGAVRAGADPAAVLPTAKAAAAELTMVEAADLAIVAGAARVTIRFEADYAELAAQIGAHVVAVTNTVARVASFRVTERAKGSWFAVGSG